MTESEKINLLNEVKRRFKARQDRNLDRLFDYISEKFIDKQPEFTSTADEKDLTPPFN